MLAIAGAAAVLVTGVGGVALLVNRAYFPAPTEAEDAWKVLALVSLEYSLGDERWRHDHSLPPYTPLLNSRHKGVREVAALGAVKEIQLLEWKRAERLRSWAATVIVPGVNVEAFPRPPGETKSGLNAPEVPTDLRDALDRATRDGATDAYTNAKLWPQVKAVDDDPDPDEIAAAFRVSARSYQLKHVVVQMDSVLFDRAEALARTTAGTNTRSDDVEVKCVFEGNLRVGKVTLLNKSASDLEHLTLAITAKLKPLSANPRGIDFLLGVGVVGRADVGNNLAGAVEYDKAARDMPVRVVVHVPKLPPGVPCSVVPAMEYDRILSVSYSLWAKEITVENQALPGLAEVLPAPVIPAQGERNPAAIKVIPKTPPAKADDLFAKGSIWRGTLVSKQTGSPPKRQQAELVVAERGGDSFNGMMTYQGTKVASAIRGVTTGNKVQWHAVDNGKAERTHSGHVTGRRMEVVYDGVGEGGKALRMTTTLDFFPAGKK